MQSVSSHTTRLRAMAIGIPLLLNMLFPTRNYYWDGISFAQTIEDVGNSGNLVRLIHPNHLFYNFIGWALYQATSHHVRALYLLQATNIFLAAVAALFIFEATLEITESGRVAALLAAFFSFSGTWWRFATDADAYIASVALLAACAWLLLRSGQPHPFLVGILHCAAMLMHELAILFYPAALIGLWYQTRKEAGDRRLMPLAIYLATSAPLTAAAYAFAYARVSPGTSFAAWMFSHAADARFSFALRNFVVSLRSWIQLFLAGRPSSVRYSDPLIIISLAALLITLVCLLVVVRKRGCHIKVAIARPSVFIVSAVWVVTYGVFLFVWLPNNTFYKLFALPGIILGIASCEIVPRGRDDRPRLAHLCVTLIALSNLSFAIIPYSRITANRAVAFAIDMHGSLEKGAVVYFRDFNTDDWLVRYFNPQTLWRHLESKEEIESELHSAPAVWLDTTALDSIRTDPESNSWLVTKAAGGEERQLVDKGHRIKFVRLIVPRDSTRP